MTEVELKFLYLQQVELNEELDAIAAEMKMARVNFKEQLTELNREYNITKEKLDAIEKRLHPD